MPQPEDPSTTGYTTGGADDAVVDAIAGAALTTEQRLAAMLPQMRIVHGDPDAEEVAALVAGLLATHAAVSAEVARSARPSAPPRGCWTDKAARLGVVRPGPGAWRTGLRPGS